MTENGYPGKQATSTAATEFNGIALHKLCKRLSRNASGYPRSRGLASFRFLDVGQKTVYPALLAYLLFILALSFSGVVEVGINLMGVGQNRVNRAGYGGSFFTGALAAVIASLCTAPFMGTALWLRSPNRYP